MGDDFPGSSFEEPPVGFHRAVHHALVQTMDRLHYSLGIVNRALSEDYSRTLSRHQFLNDNAHGALLDIQ